MSKKSVLIVGGYGTVGKVVSGILAQDERILPVIAGRKGYRAEELAGTLQCSWRTIDINDRESITAALTHIDIVINCFSGPFTHFPLHLPEICARSSIHYMDVSGSYEYSERFLKLNDCAVNNNATLITALGANPGIPGIALVNAAKSFEVLETGKIIFVLGAGLEGISISSLKELKYMMDIPAVVWNSRQWVKARLQNSKEYIGVPFEKQVYMGLSITRDLLIIPAMTGIKELSFWSGSQNTWQGLLMIIGLKWGLTKTERGASFLLNLLKSMGKHSGSDALIKIDVTGISQGRHLRQTMQLHCEENYATALAPAIVCRQFIDGAIARPGAFVPPEIVPADDFMNRLKSYSVNYSETIESVTEN
ncbi:MAG TPA: saccharopine dehydrogenase NADP-binding domain-containing protein [bacterium]|nr:saccharopine dehydrogenase NADP-binding domain-containing protein [bacterium]HPN44103.1 saccharopine dehydrogenase NADP-binding domain-containing protein [bacterium]